MRALIGVDIGTQGVKVALYAENGELLSEVFEASRLYRPKEGVVEESPDLQFSMVLTLIRSCLDCSNIEASRVAGLAIAGQMAGVIGVNEKGRAITPYDSWLDTRCGKYVELMQRMGGDEVLEKTGNAPSFNHGPKKLWWKHEQPNLYNSIRAFVQPGGHVAMRLCGLSGKDAFIDSTYLHFSGFADNRTMEWDDGLCRRFDFDRAKLPRIVKPNSVVGTLTKACARECGLPEDTPVVAGCGDTAASFLSCGAVSSGVCIDVAGTASVFGATTDDFVADSTSRTLGCGRSVIPGLWHPYAYVNGGGQNLEWFRDEILGKEKCYGELNALAAKLSEDAENPYFVPHLGGRVAPSCPKLRGSWAGLSWNATIGSMYRAMLESVALEYAGYVNILKALVPNWSLSEVRITGGGEKSVVWNQLKADRLQASVVCIDNSGGAPMGAALLAGHGIGMFPDLPSVAQKWIRFGAIFEPDPARAELSSRRIQKYRMLLDCLTDWSEAS